MTPAQTSLYWRLWRSACAAQGWNQSDRDVRMRVHHDALGKAKSTKALTNGDVDRVYAQFRLLCDPVNLRESTRLQNPGIGTMERVLHALGTMPAELVQSVCRDKFDRANWRTLSLAQATQLLMTVKRVLRRRSTGDQAAPDNDGQSQVAPAHEHAHANEPF